MWPQQHVASAYVAHGECGLWLRNLTALCQICFPQNATVLSSLQCVKHFLNYFQFSLCHCSVFCSPYLSVLYHITSILRHFSILSFFSSELLKKINYQKNDTTKICLLPLIRWKGNWEQCILTCCRTEYCSFYPCGAN